MNTTAHCVSIRDGSVSATVINHGPASAMILVRVEMRHLEAHARAIQTATLIVS
jgi:hypothetical protein